MKNPLTELSPQSKARLAGICYLITIGAGVFDHLVVGGKLVVPGDAAATAHNLAASARLYRLAFALDLIPVYVVVTAIFYALFKPVNRSLSLLAALASLVGGSVGSAIAVLQLAPLLVLQGGYLRAFDAGQLQALAMLSLDLHQVGFTISLVFFGFYCLLIGWLIALSTFLPRSVGVLMVAGGAGYMIYSFASLVSPALGSILAPYTLSLGTLGEGALTIWLLLAGVRIGSPAKVNP